MSPEWAAAFDAALDGVALPEPADDAGLVASTGRFALVQEVHGVPERGTVTVRLVVDAGAMHVSAGDGAVAGGSAVAGDGVPAGGSAAAGGEAGAGPDAGGGESAGGSSPDAVPDVTLSLSYDDAVALSRGELMAAEALTAGRIKVRGDLSVLVASQRMLVAAQPHLASVAASTTY